MSWDLRYVIQQYLNHDWIEASGRKKYIASCLLEYFIIADNFLVSSLNLQAEMENSFHAQNAFIFLSLSFFLRLNFANTFHQGLYS